MKSYFIKFSLLLAVLFLTATPAQAKDDQVKNVLHVQANEIITRNIYTLSDEIIIDGTINGDLVAIADEIIINGQLEGDLIAFSPKISINGTIGGNVRVIGVDFELNSTISRNLTIFAEKINLTEDSRILWDAAMIGTSVSSSGKIDGSLNIISNQVLLSGEVNNNVDVKLHANKKNPDSLQLIMFATGGDLNYRSTTPIKIDEASIIGGQVRADLIQPPKTFLIPTFSWGMLIYKIISALIFGLLIILVGKKYLLGLEEKIKNNPKKLIIPSLIIFFGVPFASIILFITIIGIPLSLTIIALWLILQYLAKILIMMLGGQIIIKFFRKGRPFHIIWALVLGVIISYLLFSLPVVGGLLSVLASLTGLGGLYLYVTDKPRRI